MEVVETAIEDVKILSLNRYVDERGFLSETYKRSALVRVGIGDVFVQENHSLSLTERTLRGLHFQCPPHAQAKLVRVVRGAIFDVAVDIRHSSSTFGKYVATELSAENWQQLYIPVGFAHGFLTLRPGSEVVYKLSAEYSPASDRGILWSDPDIGIPWPLGGSSPLLSEKDRKHPLLRDCPRYF
jgi:dTDP-4-dehydrorhamnose 3,5-epimerase